MHRPMSGGVGEIKKERLVPIRLGMILEETHRVVADRIGIVISLGLVLGVVNRGNELVFTAQGGWIIKTACPDDGPVEPVEPTLAGPVLLRSLGPDVAGDVPLARHVILVPGQAQSLGDGQNVAPDFPTIPGQLLVSGHQPDPGLVLVKAGEQRGPGRATTGGVVELGEAQAVLGKRIEVGGQDFPSEATDVRIAHVIREDQNDVWFADGKKGKKKRKNGCEQTHHSKIGVFSSKF